MKAVSNLIGSCISFDETGYNQNVQKLRSIVPAVNTIIRLYNELPHEKRPIDKAFLTDLNNSGMSTIEKEMVAYGELEIKRMGWKLKPMVDSCRESIYQELAPITAAFKKFEANLQITQTSLEYTYILDIDLLDIVDGQAVFTDAAKEVLKLVYSVFIEDEQTAELYNTLLDMQKTHNKFADMLHVLGVPMHPTLNPICGPHGYVYEVEGDYLEISTNAIRWLKNFIANSKRVKATA
ncbi:MAG: hypothetical protein ABIN94_01150 [Ferruginibacter sp.]